ncbi:MAG: protein kinase [Pirellulaceae bacterium]
MLDHANTCLTDDIIDRFLNEQLTDNELAAAEKHMGACAECQRRLESLVTQGNGWDSFQEQLADYPSDLFAPSDEPETLPAFNLNTLIAPTDDPQMLGRLGRYQVSGVIGQGSTGIVFRAFDAALSRNVAIKMLAPSFSHVGTSRKRFEREGRAISAVRDPHVISVHGVEEYQGNPYIVMQYIPDGSMQKRLESSGEMNTKEVCRVGMQVARGLAAAHRQGIIHRDIKPANILLEDGVERAIVTDFSLARVFDEATMTVSGTVAGTPQFMSPEQARGQTVDPRTDLFSLGCVMYAACTGKSPFQAETLLGVVHQVAESEPRSIREVNPDIAAWLEAFIFQLLKKRPEERFQSAEEVADLLQFELAHLQMPTSSPVPPRDWWQRVAPKRWLPVRAAFLLLAIAFGAIAGAAGWHYFGPDKNVLANSRYGIEPTRQELNRYKAIAAYDLAYETHLSEQDLGGDMTDSIARHKEALELGYNNARSNYRLASAFAYENRIDESLRYLDAAIHAGFHDYQAALNEPNFNRLRGTDEYQQRLNKLREMSRTWSNIDDHYFYQKDYAEAEQRLRKWLESSPNDELAITLLAAALTEQYKNAEAKLWNEKARSSVRYANFGIYNLGCIACAEGNQDLAFAYLNYSTEIGFTDAAHLEKDHLLIALRDDPRFDELLKRMRTMKQTRNPEPPLQ